MAMVITSTVWADTLWSRTRLPGRLLAADMQLPARGIPGDQQMLEGTTGEQRPLMLLRVKHTRGRRQSGSKPCGKWLTFSRLRNDFT